jgi:hypothetical protein
MAAAASNGKRIFILFASTLLFEKKVKLKKEAELNLPLL